MSLIWKSYFNWYNSNSTEKWYKQNCTFIDWEYYSDPFEIIEKLKKDWYKIYSVELDKRSIDYTELFHKNEEKICLVMWNEVAWVNQKILDLSDEIIVIPMRWKKESLNVSVAAWIVMYAC